MKAPRPNFFPLKGVLLALSMNQAAMAADFLGPAPLPEETLDPGHSKVFFNYEKRNSLHLLPHVGSDENLSAEVERTTAGIKAALGSNWQFGLLGRGISSRSDQLSNDAAFAGMQAHLEYIAVRNKPWTIAWGGFVDSGSASAQRDYVIGRSIAAKGGFYGRSLYQGEVHQFGMSLGIRYRSPEQTLGYKLRNEWVYGAKYAFAIVPSAHLFAAYDGRLMRVRHSKTNLIVENAYAVGEYKAGLAFEVADFDISVYGGRGRSHYRGDDHHFAVGKNIIGAGLAYRIGSDESPSDSGVPKMPEKSYGDEIKDDLTETSHIGQPKKPIGTAMDDFDLVDKEIEESGIRNDLKTAEQLADEEIRQLKEVEEKQRALQNKQNSIEEQLRRKRLREQLKVEAEQEKDLTRDVKDEVEELPFITDEEANWQGLDH